MRKHQVAERPARALIAHRLRYWAMSKSPAMHYVLPNTELHRTGLPLAVDLQPAEPPDTVPYVRRCGRGRGFRRPPIPEQ